MWQLFLSMPCCLFFQTFACIFWKLMVYLTILYLIFQYRFHLAHMLLIFNLNVKNHAFNKKKNITNGRFSKKNKPCMQVPLLITYKPVSCTNFTLLQTCIYRSKTVEINIPGKYNCKHFQLQTICQSLSSIYANLQTYWTPRICQSLST